MASSLINSSHHVDFDSVFGMENTGMVQMFESLIATGLKNFLGCPAVFSEASITKFFANGSVRYGLVVSTVNGVHVEFSEKVFAEAFELPIDGLTDVSDVPKNLVFDARSLFSASQEQVSISCLKKELKIEFCLLHDILAKTMFVKAGSFDAVTRERFMLMTCITCGVKVNWSSLLFNVLKEMVTPGSIQAKGFAIQICAILKSVPGLVGGEADTDAPRVKKTHVKKAVSHKRPAVDIKTAPVVKKKRTTKKRKRRLILEDDLEIDEPVAGRFTAEHPVEEATTGVQKPIPESVEQLVVVPVVAPATDDPDAVIKKVLNQLDVVFQTYNGEHPQGTVVEETVVAAKEPHWFDLPYDDLIAKWDAERPVVTASDTDEDVETMDVGAAGGDQ
ncbi:hypothetical protein F511_30852 [Dorcoceras hygrometricum]|uniref:Dystroglycan-like n=1 Tax=Dorcoceras hygrometricum TaxID=472368 RepID=A0A2Z7B4T1_9LAMI|nr:hypothetical protein F511_30852 [Dorcoceras hygrometricum]